MVARYKRGLPGEVTPSTRLTDIGGGRSSLTMSCLLEKLVDLMKARVNHELRFRVTKRQIRSFLTHRCHDDVGPDTRVMMDGDQ
jgi:hypothetical protein